MLSEWIFLSHEWGPSTPTYGNGPKAEVKIDRCLNHGDTCNTLNFSGGNHIGTHIDFPYHFVKEGKTVSQFPAGFFVFRHCAVVWLEDLPKASHITVEILNDYFAENDIGSECEILLFRTGSNLWRDEEDFYMRNIGLGLGLANALRLKFPKLRVVGMDMISTTSYAHRPIGREVHKEFLGGKQAICLLEDMNLEPLKGWQNFEVIALPFRIEGADGAPCTVIARKI